MRSFRREVKGKLSRTREKIKEMTPRPSGEPAKGLPGEDVYVVGVEADGEVLEPADSAGRVKVRVGNVTMVTDLEKLIRKSESAKKTAKTETRTDYAPEPGMEIDIRGTTFEEAEPLLEKYLDDVSIAGFKLVTIIHGKGTGALRRKVQDYLSRNRRVETHRLGNWNEGSSGVCIVTLKADC
ncbi:MAG: Smr/MutS family protein, partial [candidate division Zixibacteria bacterium]